MFRWQVGLGVLLAVILSVIPAKAAVAQDKQQDKAQSKQKDWAVTVYTGRLTDEKLFNTATFDFNFEDAYLIDVGLSRRLYTYRNYFNIELEGQVAKYFGDQDNWEFDLVAYFRWLLFPWDKYVDTSFAAGAGVSYATSTPEIEEKNYPKTSRFLGALMFEFAFALPKVPEWSLVTGIHHRSGADGLFNGVRGASNAWVLGLRYSF